MSQQQINLSPDLKKLRDEGYEVELIGGYLVIRHVPYVDELKEIKFGTLIKELTLAGDRTVRPRDHVINWQGTYPCQKDGKIIKGLNPSQTNTNLGYGLISNFTFSSKPDVGYRDYFELAETYTKIIQAPAQALNSNVKAQTFNVIVEKGTNNIFKYMDTNSSRADINEINAKFEGQRIAIIGLGGTGSYILDLVAKTRVSEINLFDDDAFLQHNAFRSPGAASLEELENHLSKVEYFGNLYSRLHQNIINHPCKIDSGNINLLKGMSFVFISIDNDEAKRVIIKYLLESKIKFVDVGMGVEVCDNTILGQIRVTIGTPEKNDHLEKRIPMVGDTANEYGTNIQIADLNALNAVLAVIRWKKLFGFYQDLENEHNSTYAINLGKLTNEDYPI